MDGGMEWSGVEQKSRLFLSPHDPIAYPVPWIASCRESLFTCPLIADRTLLFGIWLHVLIDNLSPTTIYRLPSPSLVVITTAVATRWMRWINPGQTPRN